MREDDAGYVNPEEVVQAHLDLAARDECAGAVEEGERSAVIE